MNNALKRPRILFVTPVSPFSTDSGSEQRSALMLQALQSVGTVDVLQLCHGPDTHVSVRQQKGQNYVLAWLAGANLSLQRYAPKPRFTRLVESAMRQSIANYDLVVGRYVWSVCQLLIPENIPVIVDLDDFKYRWSALAPLTLSSLVIRVKKTVSGYFMRRQLHRFSAAFFVTPLDRQESPAIHSALLPNVPCLPPKFLLSPPRANAYNVLFVGSLWYAPNAEGINWFLAHVWPEVVRQMPSATLTLVGAAPVKTLQAWERHSKVSAPGFVEDLGKAYANASLVIVPLLSGGGSNIKVLEALAFKRPCLVSTFAYSSFRDSLGDGVDVLVADTADAFIAKILNGFRNPSGAETIAMAGYQSLNLKFGSHGFMNTVASMIDQTMHAAPVPAQRPHHHEC